METKGSTSLDGTHSVRVETSLRLWNHSSGFRPPLLLGLSVYLPSVPPPPADRLSSSPSLYSSTSPLLCLTMSANLPHSVCLAHCIPVDDPSTCRLSWMSPIVIHGWWATQGSGVTSRQNITPLRTEARLTVATGLLHSVAKTTGSERRKYLARPLDRWDGKWMWRPWYSSSLTNPL